VVVGKGGDGLVLDVGVEVADRSRWLEGLVNELAAPAPGTAPIQAYLPVGIPAAVPNPPPKVAVASPDGKGYAG
jgi:hypothetical protein